MANKILLPESNASINRRKIPFCSAIVPAGFPSPADDYLEDRLDLNELLIDHPAATFFIRVEGDSMKDAGIHTGDILVVDRSIDVYNGRIIVAVLNGEFTVKRLKIEGKVVFLVPENRDYPVIEVIESDNLKVWGVVTSAIHKVL